MQTLPDEQVFANNPVDPLSVVVQTWGDQVPSDFPSYLSMEGGADVLGSLFHDLLIEAGMQDENEAFQFVQDSRYLSDDEWEGYVRDNNATMARWLDQGKSDEQNPVDSGELKRQAYDFAFYTAELAWPLLVVKVREAVEADRAKLATAVDATTEADRGDAALKRVGVLGDALRVPLGAGPIGASGEADQPQAIAAEPSATHPDAQVAVSPQSSPAQTAAVPPAVPPTGPTLAQLGHAQIHQRNAQAWGDGPFTPMPVWVKDPFVVLLDELSPEQRGLPTYQVAVTKKGKFTDPGTITVTGCRSEFERELIRRELKLLSKKRVEFHS